MSKADDFLKVIQEKNLKRQRLKTLKRSYAKIIQHPDLLDESTELKKEIDLLETDLNS